MMTTKHDLEYPRSTQTRSHAPAAAEENTLFHENNTISRQWMMCNLPKLWINTYRKEPPKNGRTFELYRE